MPNGRSLSLLRTFRYGFSPRPRTSSISTVSFSFSLQNSPLLSTYISIITLTSHYPICLPSYSRSFRPAYQFTSRLPLSIVVIRPLRFILPSPPTPPSYTTEPVSSFNKCSLIAQNIRPPCLSNRTSHLRLLNLVFFFVPNVPHTFKTIRLASPCCIHYMLYLTNPRFYDSFNTLSPLRRNVLLTLSALLPTKNPCHHSQTFRDTINIIHCHKQITQQNPGVRPSTITLKSSVTSHRARQNKSTLHF